jgi:DNA primase
MEDAYLDILKDWERNVAFPALYVHLDEFFPPFQFRRKDVGGARDRWVSPYKMNMSLPKRHVQEKTVVQRSDMRFRENGEWHDGISVVDRIMQEMHLSSVYEVDKFIAERLSLTMPKPDSKEVAEAISKSRLRASLLDTLQGYFSWNLANNESRKATSVRQYLKKQRGFTSEQASSLGLGFVPDWNKVVRYVTIDKKFRLEDLDEVCGVRNPEGHSSVGTKHVLSIPYVCGGSLKGFIFRRVDEAADGPKYIATPGLDRKSAFFNMPKSLTRKDIVVVEGEIDALKATAEGIPNVVAIGGSEISGDRRLQLEDAFRRGVERITLCLDLDPEKEDPSRGNLASRHQHLMRTLHTLKDVAPAFENVYVAPFAEPADPDEFIRGRGAYEFQELLSQALPYWTYLYRYKEGLL